MYELTCVTGAVNLIVVQGVLGIFEHLSNARVCWNVCEMHGVTFR